MKFTPATSGVYLGSATMCGWFIRSQEISPEDQGENEKTKSELPTLEEDILVLRLFVRATARAKLLYVCIFESADTEFVDFFKLH